MDGLFYMRCAASVCLQLPLRYGVVVLVGTCIDVLARGCPLGALGITEREFLLPSLEKCSTFSLLFLINYYLQRGTQ